MSCVGKQINHWTARDVPLFFLAGQIHQRRILQPPLQKIYVRLSTYQRSGLGLYINFHLILLFLMHLASPVFAGVGHSHPAVMTWRGYQFTSSIDFQLQFYVLFPSAAVQIRIFRAHYHELGSLISWAFCWLPLDFLPFFFLTRMEQLFMLHFSLYSSRISFQTNKQFLKLHSQYSCIPSYKCTIIYLTHFLLLDKFWLFPISLYYKQLSFEYFLLQIFCSCIYFLKFSSVLLLTVLVLIAH